METEYKFLFESLIIQILMKDCDNFVEAQKQLMMSMMELEKPNDLKFFDVMNVWMKSLQDVVDGFKRLAKHEKQNIKKYVKIVRVTNIVDHMI